MSNNEPKIFIDSKSWGNVLNSLEASSDAYVNISAENVSDGQTFELILNSIIYEGTLDENLQTTIVIPSSDLNTLVNNESYELHLQYHVNSTNFSSISNTFYVDFSLPIVDNVIVPFNSQLTSSFMTNLMTVGITVNTSLANDGDIVELEIRKNNSYIRSYTNNIISNQCLIEIPVEDLFSLETGKTHRFIATVRDTNDNVSNAYEHEFYVDFTEPSIVSITKDWNTYFNPELINENKTVNVNTIGVDDGVSMILHIRERDGESYIDYKTYTSTTNNNNTIFEIQQNDLKNMKNMTAYDFQILFEDASISISSISNQFIVDRNPPLLNKIETSWGEILNYNDSIVDGLIEVTTQNLENGQNVNISINGFNGLNGVVQNNIATINVQKSIYSMFSNSNTYAIYAQFEDKAGNTYVRPDYDEYTFRVEKERLVVSLIPIQDVVYKSTSHTKVDFTMVFSSQPKSLSIDKIHVVNGHIVNLSGSDLIYNATFIPDSPGDCIIQIFDSALQDIYDNNVIESNEIKWNYDGFDILSVPEEKVNVKSNFKYLVDTNSLSENLYFSILNGPSWLKLRQNTNLIYGIPFFSDMGNHLVKISVSDGVTTEIQEFEITVKQPTYDERKKLREKVLMNKKHPKSYSTYLRGKMAERKPIYNKNINNDYGWTMSRVKRLRRAGSAAPLKKSQVK